MWNTVSEIVLCARRPLFSDHADERGQDGFSNARSILLFVAKYMRSVIFLDEA